MAKFKMKMKLQGFEIELEGERDDIPLMAQNVGQQLVGLLEPTSNIASDSHPRKPVPNTNTTPTIEQKPPAKRASKNTSKSPKEPAVDWKHNPDEWGNPDQNWNPTKKAIWLLLVAENCANVTQMTAARIATTFNKHFKTSGLIRGSNVSRDLGKAKGDKPSPVGQDTGENGEFFLTETGKKLAMELALEARGQDSNGLYATN